VLTDRTGPYRHIGVVPGDYCLERLVDGNTPSERSEPFVLRPGQSVQRDL
jgi:hypothetical protein